MKKTVRVRPRRAFTLIELLIVVAIIAILAAIAVPNFLEAQVRAKTSRMRAGMRTAATALEAYAVDHNRYPYERDARLFPASVTTPVAYLTSLPLDVFRVNAISERDVPYERRTIGYFRFLPRAEESRAEVMQWRGSDADYESDDLTLERFGPWAVSSFGPDQDWDKIWGGETYRDPILTFYDPSNGTISNGDLSRSQKQQGTNTQ
jgi:prepilin-type N-terminal cleavage/methylation domain-containing protein